MGFLKDWYEGDECHPATDADPGETTWQWQSQPTEWSTAGADGAGLDRESSSGGTSQLRISESFQVQEHHLEVPAEYCRWDPIQNTDCRHLRWL